MILTITLIILILGILILTKSKKNKTDCPSQTTIKTLIRQAARWSAAAQQDKSPLIALLHANYGAGYLWALKDIASDKEIYESTGIDVIKFKNKIINIQEIATKRVSGICPQFVGDIDKYLLLLAGDI